MRKPMFIGESPYAPEKGDQPDNPGHSFRGCYNGGMDDNPYRAPKENDATAKPARKTANRSASAGILLGTTVSGALLGSFVLARFSHGPGDPSGHSVGAAIGGFLGMFGASFCISLSRGSRSDETKS